MTVSNTRIKIPETLYVGYQQRDDGNAPVGFLVPDGTDPGAVKRKATVDEWVQRSAQIYNYTTKQYDTRTVLECDSFPNELLSGFKISRSIKRCGWNGGNVVVRIEDPRGFELEITAANFIMLMNGNLVDDGEISCRCIWAREGSKNILLSENSEPYQDAIANTERAGSKVLLKDIRPGNTILLQNGATGVYLGAMFSLQNSVETVDLGLIEIQSDGSFKPSPRGNLFSSWSNTKPLISRRQSSIKPAWSCKKSYYVFNPATRCLIESSSLNVSRIIDSSEMTKAQAELWINNAMKEPFFVSDKEATYFSWKKTDILGLAYSTSEIFSQIVEISPSEAATSFTFRESICERNVLVRENESLEFHLIASTEVDEEILECSLLDNGLLSSTVLAYRYAVGPKTGYRDTYEWKPQTIKIEKSMAKFHHMYLAVNTPLGNSITAVM